MFSVALPANAACTGDTATGGYHVYSYLVTQGTAVSSLTFTTHPANGYGIVNNTGVYYGPINTAINTGQIVSIPTNFEWGPWVSVDNVALSTFLYTGGTSGVWEAGLACADSTGVLSDYWNTEVTFTASATDPSGFTWTAVPGVPGTTPTTTTTTTSTPGTTTTTTGGAPTTTTTSSPGTTTTTIATTTTTSAASATTTTTPIATASGSSGVSSSGSSGDQSGTGTVAANSASLPLTGASVRRDVAGGMLCIGLGLMFLGWSIRVRRARGPFSEAALR